MKKVPTPRFALKQLKVLLTLPLILFLTSCQVISGPVKITVIETPDPNSPTNTPAPTAASFGDTILDVITNDDDNDNDSDSGSSSSGSKSHASNATPLPADLGDVTGRILWNDEPLVGYAVTMCSRISFLDNTCSGTTYRDETDSNGIFLFPNTISGEYNIAANFNDGQGWIPIRGEFGSFPRKFEIDSTEANRVGEFSLIRENLKIEFPPAGQNLLANEIDIRWTPYPEATHYIVYLAPDEGEAVISHERYETSELTVDPNRLLNCEYALKIDAHNDFGTQIAENSSYHRFNVTGQDADCVLNVDLPFNGSSLDNTGSILLDWEPHPYASYYRILMWYDDDPEHPHILSFVEVTESEYLLEEDLKSGRYVWSIDVFDSNKVEVAGSAILDFNIR